MRRLSSAETSNSEIIAFTKGGRDIRFSRLQQGDEAPREFFYGFPALEPAGLSASLFSSAGAVPGFAGRVADFAEGLMARLTGIGIRPLSARLRMASLPQAKVILSYTDGFSLSLGYASAGRKNRPIILGGFHALSDIEERVPAPMQRLSRALIRRSLAGIDHIFFFGPADRQFAIDRYDIEPNRTSVIPFGIDTDFWRPLTDTRTEDFVVAVGQDPNRDYDLLAIAPGQHPIKIVTRRKVKVPANASHIQILAGDYFGAESMSDDELRRTYNRAKAVVVPLKDVWQPSGYSVTLQAMSCGRPVILSKIRGLWAPELFKDGENCLLVQPGNAAALGGAIDRVRSDTDFCAQLGRAARETAVKHFNLDRGHKGTLELAKLGLSLWRDRK